MLSLEGMIPARTHAESSFAVKQGPYAHQFRVGKELFTVYGDETIGFSIDPSMPTAWRHRSLEEAFFALLSLYGPEFYGS